MSPIPEQICHVRIESIESCRGVSGRFHTLCHMRIIDGDNAGAIVYYRYATWHSQSRTVARFLGLPLKPKEYPDAVGLIFRAKIMKRWYNGVVGNQITLLRKGTKDGIHKGSKCRTSWLRAAARWLGGR